SALVTGLLCQYAGWRSAFILPGIVTVAIGLGFMAKVRHEVRTGHKHVGALAQYTIGGLVDRHSLKSVFLPVSVLLAPLLWFGASLSGVPLVLVVIGIVIGIFGHATINDAMIGKYTSEEWRARAYAIRYFVGFTA